MSAKRVFVIAPIGNPHAWRPVLYYIDSLCSVSSKWTTVALAVKACRECCGSEEGVKVLAIAADTLYTLFPKNHPRTWKEIENTVRENTHKTLLDILKNESPSDILKNESSSDCKGCFDLLKNRNDLLEVAVCPGIGLYDMKEFRGSLELYHLCVLLNGLEFIIKHLEDAKDVEISIWLDLSHGVNYMPSTSLIALLSLSRILSLYGLKHSVEIYNSDPVPQKEATNVKLRINKLTLDIGYASASSIPLPGGDRERIILELFEDPYRLFSKTYRGPARQLHNTKEDIKEIVRELWYATAYGYTLLLLTNAQRYGQLFRFRDLVENLREHFYDALKRVKFDDETSEKKIMSTSKILNENGNYSQAYPEFLELYALFKNLLELVSQKVGSRCPEDGYAISEVKDISKDVLKRYSFPHIEHFIGREIIDIAMTVKSCQQRGEDLSSWKPWKELRSRCLGEKERVGLRYDLEEKELEELTKEVYVKYSVESSELRKRISDRNFIAHLGLVYDLVNVKRVSVK